MTLTTSRTLLVRVTSTHLKLSLILSLLSLALILSTVGCDDAEPSSDPAELKRFELSFSAAFDEVARGGSVEPVVCGGVYTEVGATRSTVRLKDLRMYISGVELITASGEATPLTLEEREPWQSGGVALIDFEDGSADCGESGNEPTNLVISGLAPDLEYTAVRFSLGVPETLNHQDVATAAAPLNVGSMFWVWQAGYKFLRAELIVERDAGDDAGDEDDEAEAEAPWFIHLGSVGCESPAPTVSPEVTCARPNRAQFTLSGLDATLNEGPDGASARVHLNLNTLFEGANLNANTPDTPPGCMSRPNERTECAPIYQSLALDFMSGEPIACDEGACSAPFTLY